MRSQDGFTLIELLVAMALGLIVLFALTQIFIVTIDQSRRTFTRVDATRQARIALAKIENELHSACTDGPQAAPVQTGADGNDLDFLSYTGTAASPTPVWHQITLASGTLTDYSYGVTGTAPNWGRATNYTSSNVLLSNVVQNGSTPPFQYFAYASFAGTDGNTYWTIPDGTNPNPVTGAAMAAAPLATPLTDAGSNSTVEVMINLLVGPTSENLNNLALTSEDDPVQDSVSLRLTTPPDNSPGPTSEDYMPCE